MQLTYNHRCPAGPHQGERVPAEGGSADAALPAVHVVDRFALDQPGHPVDESLAVDLLGVERLVAEHRLRAARRGLAIHLAPDRRPLEAERAGGCPQPGLRGRPRSRARDRSHLHRRAASDPRRRRIDPAHLAPPRRPRRPPDPPDRRHQHPTKGVFENALPGPPKPDRRRDSRGHRIAMREAPDA
jgi:hypothetical protein